jgi:hypothetical protein
MGQVASESPDEITLTDQHLAALILGVGGMGDTTGHA